MFAGSHWVGGDSKFVFRVTAQLDCGSSRAQRGSDGTCLHLLGFSWKTSAFARPSMKNPLYRDTIANQMLDTAVQSARGSANKTRRKTVKLINSRLPRRHRRCLSPELYA